ncbi:MAG: bifunctional YncE family protein/alkaline phosphatase family protein [Acidobacteriota bacterium]
MLLTLLLAVITLPTGWRLDPAGVEIPVDTFPVHAQLLPGNQHALLFHSGFKPPSLAVLHLASRKIIHSLPLPEAGIDFAFHPATRRAYVPLGHAAGLAVVAVSPTHQLTLEKTIPAPTGHVSTVAHRDGLVALTHTLGDTVVLVNLTTGAEARRLTIPRPTRALFHQNHLYVLSHEPASLHVINLPNLTPVTTVPLSRGPSSLVVHKDRLYVTASLSNHLDILLLADPAHPKPAERLNLAPSPTWPVGLSPTSVTSDPATNRLFISCSDANAIAVYDVARRKLSGYLPTAWYPTFALPLPSRGLLVLNGKGERSYPNPQGPNPTVHRTMTPQPPSPIQYTPLIQLGSARLVTNLTPAAVQKHSEAYAKLTPAITPAPAGPLPPIRHVVYIMKENRTYDQVLGDLPAGNGDPSLCLFPENITPNHHKLAREFVLFDNFYVNADVSSEGWMWSSAAITPPAVMRAWPAAYAGRSRPAPKPINDTPGGFLWTSALKAGVSFRNFGFFVSNRPGAKPGEPIVASVSDPALLPYTNSLYGGYDPDFPDVARARIFIEELERTGSLPQLTVMVLPNDHTWGTSPGKLTPNASMADNDVALGRIVEAISKSPAWPHTAIFVLEDDAQNGPDHVDSHRSPAFVISPYTRRAAVDHTFYNTTSMLRTIEMLLQLPPLTHYDATATVMFPAFSSTPDLRPYLAEAPRVSLDTKNPPGTAASARLDFSAPDHVTDDVLTALVWQTLRGVPPPPPTRAAFLSYSPD